MNKLLLAGFSALALLQAPAALARPMTATDLVTMKRLGAPVVSPDGRWAAYQVRETDLPANRGRTDLYLHDLQGRAQPVKIASLPQHNEHDPRFSADGRHLYFLSNQSGSEQLWRVALPAGRPEQLTRFATGIAGYRLSPSGDRLAVWGDRDIRCQDINCANVPAEEQGQGSGRVYDEVFVRHWDTWVEPNVRSRVFVLPLVNGVPQGAGRPVGGTLVGDSPTKPFGGAEQVAFAPDGRTVFFVLREGGRGEPTSTNLDIYAAPADGSGAPVNLTQGNQALDDMPTPSPDGRYLAYVAMARPGYEADRQVLHVRDLRTGATRALTQGWDRSVGSIAWAPDSRSLYVTAQDVLDTPLFRVDLGSGRVTRLTQAGTVSNAVPLPQGGVLVTMNNVTHPDDLFLLDGRNRLNRLTELNGQVLRELDPVHVQRFRFAGAGGEPVWGQIVRPANVQGQLPVAYLIHGGPQGSFNDSWSWRWNPRLFSAPGYASVSVDFHGSTGYGQAFTDSINRDWGGKPLEDLRLGLAAAGRADPAIDVGNACALGGSYGGYMVNWIAGNWPDGFKCLVNHAGILDQRAMMWSTEELWFTEWDFGGPEWDPQVRATIDRWNPVNHIDKWQTPMLVIHGEQDFRVPYTQGLATFNVLQRKGIPSRFLYFADENHWILKPQNSIQWYREVHGWLDRYLRQGSETARGASGN